MHEWKGIQKFYAHIIRQIENGLAAWWQDFSGVETPLLIKYVKTDKTRKSFYICMLTMKRKLQKGMILFFIVPIIREGSILKTLLTLVTLKGVERYLQHICATCWRENQKKLYHPECSKDCLHQDEWLEFKSSPDVTSSVLNPLADILLPHYVLNEITDYVNISFKENCELFCKKKHSTCICKLIYDYAVNCKKIAILSPSYVPIRNL